MASKGAIGYLCWGFSLFLFFLFNYDEKFLNHITMAMITKNTSLFWATVQCSSKTGSSFFSQNACSETKLHQPLSLPPTFTLQEKLIFSLFCALGVLSKNRAVVPRVWKMESVDQQLPTQLEGTKELWHSTLQYSHIVNDNARPRATGVF